jgi:hypothetical protein
VANAIIASRVDMTTRCDRRFALSPSRSEVVEDGKLKSSKAVSSAKERMAKKRRWQPLGADLCSANREDRARSTFRRGREVRRWGRLRY